MRETGKESEVGLRWRLGIVLLGAGICIIVGLWVVVTFFPTEGFETYSRMMFMFGIISVLVGFAAIATSPGKLSKDGVWSLKTGPLRFADRLIDSSLH
ncbi:MAG: hypothetical protein ACXADC_13505 [Candidatus Thorarchaeota archaeon]|jgi:hypothetical protein